MQVSVPYLSPICMFESFLCFTEVLKRRFKSKIRQKTKRGCYFGACWTELWITAKRQLLFCHLSLEHRCHSMWCHTGESDSWPPHFSVLHFRWETLQVHVGGLRLEIRSLGWINAPLQEAHGGKALPVCCLQSQLLALRSPGSPHEEASELKAGLVAAAVLYLCNFLLTLDVQLKLV